jgi:3-dehydroquinate synthase
MKELRIDLKERSYGIAVGAGLIGSLSDFMALDRSVLIVTDSGVPKKYAECVASQCKNARIFTFPEGEESKNFDTYRSILTEMLDFGMQRKDAVVAVGGGVCGDMAGFAASTYMRGVDFYNIPTTLLSQVDSSVGGKTAIDFCGVKNIVGAFYQPRAVVIDTDTLKTLDKRQLAAGKAEIIKEAVTFDAPLFEKIENEGFTDENLEDLILGALKIKARVVELDEKEGHLRKALNFGHTFGHGVEALGGRLHGECVAIGMIPMAVPEVRERLKTVLKAADLPTEFTGDFAKAFEYMSHDKKGDGRAVDAVFCPRVGEHEIKKISLDELGEIIKKGLA